MLALCEFLLLCEGNTFAKHVLVFRLPANTTRLLLLHDDTFRKHVLVHRLRGKIARHYTLHETILKAYFCDQVAREDCQTVPVQKCESVKDEQCRNVPRQVMRGKLEIILNSGNHKMLTKVISYLWSSCVRFAQMCRRRGVAGSQGNSAGASQRKLSLDYIRL